MFVLLSGVGMLVERKQVVRITESSFEFPDGLETRRIPLKDIRGANVFSHFLVVETSESKFTAHLTFTRPWEVLAILRDVAVKNCPLGSDHRSSG